jgi:predicted nucleic acid-binding protein
VIVLDASAAIELLLQTPRAAHVEKRVLRRGVTLHAPALIDLEVAQVLRRYVHRAEIDDVRASSAVALFGRFPVQRYTHEPLLDRIWALRANLTAYDAAYVALAEGLRAPLITCDARVGSAPGVRATIEVID